MIRKVARNVAAAVCLLIGIVGLFFPFIQGIVMIVLAVVIADFEAKERLLERYRHTRIGRHLWNRHEARKAHDAARQRNIAEPVPRSTEESDPPEK